MAALLLSAVTSEGYTKVGRTDKKKKDYKSTMVYTPIKYNLMIKGNIGYITTSNDNSTTGYILDNKMYYGFGIGGEYHTKGKLAFGIYFDKFYKSYSVGSYNDNFIVNTYTVSWIYKFKTKRTSIPIATLNFGIAKPDIKNASTGKTIKFGLGFIGHTQGSINLRGLFYFQHFFSSDELTNYISDGKLDVAGLELMLGIPL